MDLSLSEEQTELVATVRSLLAKRSDSGAVRTAIASEAGFDADLWQVLCEQIGVAALAVPEEHDGVGATLVESVLVLEEIGRALAPVPALSSLVTAEAVLAGADDDAAARLLPRLAAGEIGAFAVLEGGQASAVLDADLADVLVAADGEHLYEVDPTAAQVSWTPSMDQTLRLGSLQVDVATATRIGSAAPRCRRGTKRSCCRGRWWSSSSCDDARPAQPNDAHLVLKRAHALGQLFGAPHVHRAALALP